MITETRVHKCNQCQSQNIIKNGFDSRGNQRYKCKDCGKSGKLSDTLGNADRHRIPRSHVAEGTRRESMKVTEKISTDSEVPFPEPNEEVGTGNVNGRICTPIPYGIRAILGSVITALVNIITIVLFLDIVAMNQRGNLLVLSVTVLVSIRLVDLFYINYRSNEKSAFTFFTLLSILLLAALLIGLLLPLVHSGMLEQEAPLPTFSLSETDLSPVVTPQPVFTNTLPLRKMPTDLPSFATTKTPTVTIAQTSAQTSIPTRSVSTAGPTQKPLRTRTAVPVSTLNSTSTSDSTVVPTFTATPSVPLTSTVTLTSIGDKTSTPLVTPSASYTPREAPSVTMTLSLSPTPTASYTGMSTFTSMPSYTPIMTVSMTLPSTPTSTSTSITLPTSIVTPLSSNTPTNTPSHTDTPTPTLTWHKPTKTSSQTPTATTSSRSGFEGCTPGYWKNHLSAWEPTGYGKFDDFDTTFGVDFFNPDISLTQSLYLQGGQEMSLARQGTAALLNASHPNVDYPLSAAQVIALVQAGDVSILEESNEAACPLY
jgi:hypothetical protein